MRTKCLKWTDAWLLYLAVMILFARPTHAQIGAPPPGMGINAHQGRVNDAGKMNIAQTDGFGWIRVDPALDSDLSGIVSRGMKAILCDGSTDSNYWKTVATQYAGRGYIYELVNEPNGGGNVSAQSLANLCSTAGALIHQADPTAIVCSGGIAWFDWIYLPAFMNAYAANGGTGLDAIGVHEYWMSKINSNGPEGVMNPEYVFSNMTQWKSTINQYLPNNNLGDMMTEAAPALYECGMDQHEYAYLYVREYLCDWIQGFKIVSYYDMDDNTAGKLWGLFSYDDNGNLRRANTALQYMTSTIKGRTLSSFTPSNKTLSNNGIWTMILSGSPAIEIAWVPQGAATVSVPAATACHDQYGNAVSLVNNSVSMNAASGVYYFTLLSPPQLTAVLSEASVILKWPTNVAGFTLQSTSNLVSPAFWSPNVPGPVIVNGQNTVTNPISGAQQFFRLSQ